MSSSAFFLHVPVDKIEVLSVGVTASDLFFFMGDNSQMILPTYATLRTPASAETFRRKIEITTVRFMTAGRKDLIEFRGMFSGQPVLGVLQGTNKRHTKLRGTFSRA